MGPWKTKVDVSLIWWSVPSDLGEVTLVSSTTRGLTLGLRMSLVRAQVLVAFLSISEGLKLPQKVGFCFKMTHYLSFQIPLNIACLSGHE